MALAGVEGTMCGDAGDFLIERNLVKQIGRHGRVAHVAGGELGGPDFQGSPVDPEVDLAPDPTFGAVYLLRSKSIHPENHCIFRCMI